MTIMARNAERREKSRDGDSCSTTHFSASPFSTNPVTTSYTPVSFDMEAPTRVASRISVKAEKNTSRPSSKKGTGFWMIFVSLMISVSLSAVELSAVSTAMPDIINDLHGSNFAWAATAYNLASTAFLPMTGGLAQIFGRRPVLIFSLLLFTLGSALCGSAQSMNWFIGARVVQGLGGSGILSLTSIIVSDLVSLQERGSYNGIIGLAWAFSIAIGPLLGGGLASAGQWRWVFYINLPICVIAIALVMVFLRLPTPPGTLKEKLKQMDWIGNAIMIVSTTLLVIAITWDGVDFPWSSAHVLGTLIPGFLGLVLFFYYEAKFATHPIIPFTLLSNRSSLGGYIQNFINFLLTLAMIYYIPVYYQSCKDATPVRSGVVLLSLALVLAPFLIIAGVSVTITKRYRPQTWFAWVVLIIGFAALTTLKADTSISHAVGFSALLGAGSGILCAILYFPVLAPLDVSENAHALAFFAWTRSFAGVWGISIGATILQNQLGKRLPQGFLAQLPSGASGAGFVYSIIPEIKNMEEPLKNQVREAFGGSLVVIWQVMAGIAANGAIASVFMPNLELQNQMDEKWAVETKTINDSIM
ncbi:Mfs1.2 [Mycena floridula]|nr:Mfs1.2 [Mycena floridula]